MASRNASFHEGGIAGALLAPLKLIFAFALTFVGITLVAWIIDWTFVFKVWPDTVHQLKSIMAADLARALDLAARQGVAPSLVTGTANCFYALVFKMTAIHDMAIRFAVGAELSIPDTIVRNTYIANRDTIEVAMIGTQLLGVRLATVALLVPLLALIYVVAAVDGLAQRAIRRECGGRESASLYHRAKRLQVALIAISLLFCLLWPAAVDVRWIVIPLAAAMAILARLQWAYYKKHL